MMKKRPELTSLLGWFLAALAFGFAFKTIVDLDFWWHLATGRYLVTTGTTVSQDVFSFTYQGAPWVDLTWGYETLIFWLHRLGGGFWLITFFMSVLSGATVYLGWRTFLRLRPNPEPVPALAAFFLFLFSIVMAESRWMNRPEQLTHCFGAGVLFLLVDDWIRERGTEQASKFLWLIPAVQIIWVNTHGLFVLGPALIGFFLLGKCADALWEGKLRAPDEWPAWLAQERLCRILVVTLAVCLLNPRGWTGATFPIHLWTVLNHPFYHVTIPEGTNPLRDAVWGWGTWAFVLYSLVALLSLFWPRGQEALRKKGKEYGLGYFLLVPVLIWFSILARRNIALLFLWTSPWVATFLAGLAARWRPIQASRIASLTAGLTTAAVAFALVTNLYRSPSSDQRFGGEIAIHAQPDGAARFLKSLPFAPRLFGDVHFSDYLLFAAPGYQSYIDGRFAELYPYPHFQRYMDVLAHPWFVEEEAKKYSLGGVAVGPGAGINQGILNFLANRKGWHLVYVDEASVIFFTDTAIQELKKKGVEVTPVQTLVEQATDRILETPPSNPFLDTLNVRRDEDKALALTHLSITLMILGQPALADHVLQVISTHVPDFGPALAPQCAVAYAHLESKANARLAKNKRENIAIELSSDIARVKQICRMAIEEGSEKEPARLTLALIDMNLGEWEESTTLLNQTVREDPLNYQAYLLLGRVEASTGPEGVELAEKSYLEAARLRPYDPEALLELGRILQMAGQPKRAELILAEAQRREKVGTLPSTVSSTDSRRAPASDDDSE